MKIEDYAKKSFLALKNPFNTVSYVNPLVVDQVSHSIEKNGFAYYMGVKDTHIIPQSFLKKLEDGGFLLHTKDVMAPGGRAIDVYHRNPLTDRFMTGSSSGTALNVFYHINDLGIGTDGGGSVLAPAASLNLYGFISPCMEQEKLAKFEKISTDGISFSPSLGFISRDFETLEKAITTTLSLGNSKEIKLKVPQGVSCNYSKTEEIPWIDLTQDRKQLIEFLNSHISKGQALLSKEGPIDNVGIGDTIFGHFDHRTKEIQKASNKGLMRVVNICGFSAFCLPQKELGCTIVLICQSNTEDIASTLNIAKQIQVESSPLIQSYFSNLDMYL